MKPGLFVLVVGPSGAGNDTVLNQARTRLSGMTDIVFARRVVTRATDATEDHECVDDTAFNRRRFALSWFAQGLRHGLPFQVEVEVEVEVELEAGRTVIANVSRTVIADAQRHQPVSSSRPQPRQKSSPRGSPRVIAKPQQRSLPVRQFS